MIRFSIPGRTESVEISHLLLDLNGTLSLDGKLIPGVKTLLSGLSEDLTLHVLTADTFGTAEEICKDLPVRLQILKKENQAIQKWQYLQETGPDISVAIGNGMNDYMMLADAAIGIAVLGPEGLSGSACTAAGILSPSIEYALELLLHPARIIATLRN
jgi:P-type E1-E2 ATPase